MTDLGTMVFFAVAAAAAAQDTTDYMFRVYLCCEADGWKPVRMNRIPGQGFDLFVNGCCKQHRRAYCLQN